MFIEGKAVVNGENLNILKRLHHENQEINHEKHELNQGHLFSFIFFSFLLVMYNTFTAHKGFSRITSLYHRIVAAVRSSRLLLWLVIACLHYRFQ